MSDNYHGEITIGGKLKRELLPSLQSVLEIELCDDDKESIQTELDGSIGKHPINFTDSEARNGRFEDTEAFCREHGLIFQVASGNYYEYMAESTYWDGSNERTLVCNNDQDVVIPQYKVIGYLESAKKFCADPSLIPLNLETTNNYNKDVIEAILKHGLKDPLEVFEHILAKEYPEFPAVPPLEIID